MRLCALGHKGIIKKESSLNLISSHGPPAGACVVSMNLLTGVSQLMVSEVNLTVDD